MSELEYTGIMEKLSVLDKKFSMRPVDAAVPA
jgi:hypothetical protein